MPTPTTPWRQGSPCWIDAQLADVAAGRAFYSALLGWEFDELPPEAGGYTMARVGGAVVAGLGPLPEQAQQTGQAGQHGQAGTWTTYFASDDADATHAAVLAAGGRSYMEPFDVLDAGRMFVAADPTGAVFGVWQARSHDGTQLAGEPGAMCWNEEHTTGYARAQAFYQQVFGWRYLEIGNGDDFVYAQFTVAEAPEGEFSGGMMDATTMPEPAPSHWLAWVAVRDTDAAAARLTELGGQVLVGPHTSPFGRMIVARGAQGEVLGLIDPEVTAGEAPGPA